MILYIGLSLLPVSLPGWVCTKTGTFPGTASTTGNTDGATAVLTNVADTSGVYPGDWIEIAAGFPSTGPSQVVDKTAATITVNAPSNSAQVGVTISTSVPEFKAMANLL